MGELVSKPFLVALKKHGRAHPHVTLVTNDLTKSCEADGFRDEFPDRHVSAEVGQHLNVTLGEMIEGSGSEFQFLTRHV